MVQFHWRVLMGDNLHSLSNGEAEALVQFLKESGGEYVAVFPHRTGAKPYFRAAGYGGFSVKLLLGRSHRVEDSWLTEEETLDDFTGSVGVEVKHRSMTPRSVWGTDELKWGGDGGE